MANAYSETRKFLHGDLPPDEPRSNLAPKRLSLTITARCRKILENHHATFLLPFANHALPMTWNG